MYDSYHIVALKIVYGGSGGALLNWVNIYAIMFHIYILFGSQDLLIYIWLISNKPRIKKKINMIIRKELLRNLAWNILSVVEI